MVWVIEIECSNFQLKLTSYYPKPRPLSNISVVGKTYFFFAINITLDNNEEYC